MSDLLILISSGILSSVITILMFFFVNHLREKERKKKAEVLFNLVKKNRPKHYNSLKNIFLNNNIELDDLEYKITKLLNLENLFFTEIFKSLLNDKSYNLNIVFRSYIEFITYTELFLSEGFKCKKTSDSFQDNADAFKENCTDNSTDKFTEKIMFEEFSEKLIEETNTHSVISGNNSKTNNQGERVLIEKTLTDELENV